MLPQPSLATTALHADDVDHDAHPNHPIAAPLTSSSTYRAPHPDSDVAQRIKSVGEENALDFEDPEIHIYSRITDETRLRTEKVLGKVCNGHALLYSSGLAAAYGAILHYNPSTIAIRGGYHGVWSIIETWQRSHKLEVIDLDAEYPVIKAATQDEKDPHPKGGGLLVWVETPLNPTGEARDIQHYADRAHAAGGHLVVDSTFAPPPLQDPFAHGCDIIMHSATKYMGGHSDLLAGVLVAPSSKIWNALWLDRMYVGGAPGSMESWLLLRSLRTLSIRAKAQAATATRLVQWLFSLSAAGPEPADATDKELKKNGIIARVWHSSLQPRQDADPLGRAMEGKDFNPKDQMKHWNPCFSIRLQDEKVALYLPHATQYFTPATSLGGVESLMEWRKAADITEEPGLVRLSIGLEEFEDLQADLRDALLALSKGERMAKAEPKLGKKALQSGMLD